MYPYGFDIFNQNSFHRCNFVFLYKERHPIYDFEDTVAACNHHFYQAGSEPSRSSLDPLAIVYVSQMKSKPILLNDYRIFPQSRNLNEINLSIR